MSKESLELFASEAVECDELFIGSRSGTIEEFLPTETNTIAYVESDSLLPASSLVFATRSLQVAIFAGSVWSKDGWSGWHSYRDEDGLDFHEFFAAPCVLRDALDTGGFVYRVPAQLFKPGPIPGEYVSSTPVPVRGLPHLTNVRDMTVRIAETPYWRSRPEIGYRHQPPALDEERYRSLESDIRKELPEDQRHGYHLMRFIS